ncbi:MAG: methionine ABC transporter ATP-binding protein [Actinomycetaceae bacterium]|nr:methionine ABC transporter ATP-binding protein [Actinomycetaceae bacterium]
MIELNDVYKVYPRKKQDNLHALDGINLKIYEGDIHGIVGQSGAGKSTLIRCLTALEKPTSGSIYVDGEDLSALAERELPKARRAIGMVFQAAHLFDSRTAAGNIAYPLYLAKQKRGTRHERVEELLALVGLSGRGSSYPSQLSGGQQQRVGIARALADNPSVLLCDEPTSALDTESTQQILHLIRDLRDRLGVTVVIITHEMSVVREICDSVTLLESGRMVQTGRVEDIIAQPETRLAQELVPPPRVDEEVQLDGKYTRVIDIAFTSTPGKPTGAKVMSVVADEGADVVGGTFETIGKTQVGRLALAVPVGRVEHAVRTFRSLGIYTEVRK